MTTGAAAVVAGALLIAGARPAWAQRQTIGSVEAIHRWVEAVNEHAPGRPDASVAAVTAMTYSARRELNTSFSLFVRVLRESEVLTTRSELEKGVTSLARTVRLTPGAEAFLERAAVLHSDAVILAGRFPMPPDDAPWPPTRDETPPPLLTNSRVTLTRDGEVIGDKPADWNLPFARSLLDELFMRTEHSVGFPRLSNDDLAFVGEWYHAVAAYLFATGMNGDATSHLQEAARVLPDDARLLFDRATYAETLGLPIYQAVQSTASSRPNTFIARIPAEDKTNAEAERLYRRAIEVDPSYVEARVRLARLIDRRGQHDEAAAEITKALEAQPAGVAGFYARIVAGRIAAARGRYDEALGHYRDASALFAHAQSALLGASQAALMLADVPQAQAPLAQFAGDRAAAGADPWWDYQLGAGRDAVTLLRVMWAAVVR